MKKFLLYLFLALTIFASILTYILYSEGAFQKYEPTKESDLKPFMKCESGKCATGKCAANP